MTSPLETPSDFTKLNLEGVINRLQYVGEAITLTRQCLEGKVPLIGFSGAPVRTLTFICYAIYVYNFHFVIVDVNGLHD